MYDYPCYNFEHRGHRSNRESRIGVDTKQLQGELGNRHTHILIFIVIDCTEFHHTLFFF